MGCAQSKIEVKPKTEPKIEVIPKVEDPIVKIEEPKPSSFSFNNGHQPVQAEKEKRSSIADAVEKLSSKPILGDDGAVIGSLSNKIAKRMSAKMTEAQARVEIKRERQVGVRAEVLDDTKKEVENIPKSEESRIAINIALRTSALFLNMEPKQMDAIINAMDRTSIPKDAYVCKIGEAAKHFYAIEKGEVDVFISAIEKGQKIMKKTRTLTAGASFGEAFLFNVKRTASVQATQDTIVWGISRLNFRKVLKNLVELEAKEIFSFLEEHLPFIKEIGVEDMPNFQKAIEVKNYTKGQKILEAGYPGDGFYVVVEGTVRVYVDLDEKRKVHERLSKRAQEEAVIEDSSWRRFQEMPKKESASKFKLTVKKNDSTYSSLSFSDSEVKEVDGEICLNISSPARALNRTISMVAKHRADSITGVEERGVLKPGDFFGERSLLTDEETAASVSTITDNAKVIKIDKFFFMRYLSGIPFISERSRKLYGILILKSVPILKDLTAEQRKVIRGLFETRVYHEGESIILQGDESRSFYIISYGEVQIEQKIIIPKSDYHSDFVIEEGAINSVEEFNENGTAFVRLHIILGKMGQGNYFGESGLYHNIERNASVIALTETSCLTLKKENFSKLMEFRHKNNNKQIIMPIIDRNDSTWTSNHQRKQTQQLSVDLLPKYNSVILDNHTLDDFKAAPEVLGMGAFGEVRVIKNIRSGSYFACKIIRKSLMSENENPAFTYDLIKQEVRVMSEIERSNFIVNLHLTFKDRKALYIITDLVGGRELYSYLQEFGAYLNETTQRFFISNIVIMLKHLHEQQIAYRDLKPENLIINSDGYMKLIDFGFARRVKNKTWTFCGSPDYLAPEIISCVGHDIMADYWSLGVVAFEIVVGVTPFSDPKNDSPYLTYSNILMGKIIAKAKNDVSKHFLDLIDRLLQNKKADRLGAHGTTEIMKHDYFKEMDWDLLEAQKIIPPWVPGNSTVENVKTKYKDEEWIQLSQEDEPDTEVPLDWFDLADW